jgi:hypothetical protein
MIPLSVPVAGNTPPAVTRNVADAVPESVPVMMNVWSPSVSVARIVHVNVTSPLASAVCVPRSNATERWTPVTISPGWNPVPWPVWT